MLKIFRAVVTVLALVAVSAAGYKLFHAQIEAEVYRDRLETLSTDYEQLRSSYNQAVRRTAVTELLVDESTICVIIRDASGQTQTLPTHFDPRGEVYVDYVVLDGRLWIRRIFDEKTAPRDAMVIDPKLAQVDWDLDGAQHGKAIYRQMKPGRWVVSVTGDGSLGLALAEDDEAVDLIAAPAVRDFEPIDEAVSRTASEVGIIEAARVMAR